MKLLFPDIHKDINFSKGYQFLDKELEKVLKESLTGKLRADKLVKVYLKNGREQYILIHIEIQGRKEKEFEQRMYVYNYRIYDRYRIDVVSLAVLADGNKNFRPSKYEVKYWGFTHIFEFPTVKLLDYDEKELETSDNIFAIIVLANLKSLKTKNKIDERLLVKKSLIKQLYDKGLTKDEIINLYRFIDWVISLPKEIEETLYEEIKEYEKEVIKMPYLSTAERIGMEKGMEKGIEKGIEKAKQDDLIALLEAKFGKLTAKEKEKIKNCKDVKKLNSAILKVIKLNSKEKILKLL